MDGNIVHPGAQARVVGQRPLEPVLSKNRSTVAPPEPEHTQRTHHILDPIEQLAVGERHGLGTCTCEDAKRRMRIPSVDRPEDEVDQGSPRKVGLVRRVAAERHGDVAETRCAQSNRISNVRSRSGRSVCSTLQ